MRASILAGILSIALTVSSFAQPYAWLPGSTVNPSDLTGDRVVVVDLGNDQIVGPADGWDYTDNSPGADPFVPGFSPDGSIVYLVNGGDGDASEPDGHIYVYDTSNVISSLANSLTPDPAIDIETITSDDADAIEPVGLTISPLGDRAYFIDGKDQKLHVFDIQSDGSLDVVTVINTGNRPSPLWLTSDATKGYFGSFQGDPPTSPVINVVDTTAVPPIITDMIEVTIPEQTDATTFPYVSCGFPMPEGSSTTVLPFPADAPADDSTLYVFAGYAGFRAITGAPFPAEVVNNDDFDFHEIDTSSDTVANSMTISPAGDQTVFPPLIHAYENEGENRDYIHMGGTTLYQEDGILYSVKTPDQPSDQLVIGFGQLAPSVEAFYVGSLAAADGLTLLGSETYAPVRDTSILYKMDLPPSVSARIINTMITLDPIATLDRSINFVLGYAGDKAVVGASDTFMVVRPDDAIGGDASSRDTLVFLYDTVNTTSETLALELIAGAYGQQPNPTITVDLPPVVNITTPSTNTVIAFGETTFEFAGTASDDQLVSGVLYQVNSGDMLVASGTESWSFTATGLEVGNNLVEVVAVDSNDQRSPAASRIITRLPAPENTAPNVVITTPSMDIEVPFEQSSYDVSGTASDAESTVTMVLYRVNLTGPFLEATGTANWTFSTNLNVGTNLVEVKAVDDEDLESTPVTRTITRAEEVINVPPTVTVTEPPGDKTIPFVQTLVDFSGTADDADGNLDSIQWRMDGGSYNNATITQTTGTMVAWTFTGGPFEVGATLVEIRAVDTLDAASTPVTRIITREEAPPNEKPVVTITTPASNLTVPNSQTTLQFLGMASDDTGVAEIQYRVNGGSFTTAAGTNNWSFDAPLEPGVNLVEVKAIDDDDAESDIASRTITRLAGDPPDLIVLTEFQDVWLSRNTSGSYAPAQRMHAIGFRHFYPDDFVTLAGDVNDDGQTDLISITSLGEAWIAQNDLAMFDPTRRTSTGWLIDLDNGAIVLAGDVDGDGLTDLVQTAGNGDLSVGFNTGGEIPSPTFAINFGTTFSFTGGVNVATGDINNDGNADIIHISSAGDIMAAHGNATGFDTPVSYGSTGLRHDPAANYGIHYGDFNDDGDLDIVQIHDKVATVALGDTGATFASATSWGEIGFHDDPNRGNGWWVFAADANADGIDDLVQLNEYGEIWTAISNGTDGFANPTKAAVLGYEHRPEGPWQVFTGNINFESTLR